MPHKPHNPPQRWVFFCLLKHKIRTNNSIIHIIELLVLDNIEPLVHIYLTDIKKAHRPEKSNALLQKLRDQL